MKYKQVNIGDIIEREVIKRHITKSRFSDGIGIKKQNVDSQVFRKTSLDTSLLIRISEFLEVDFFSYYRIEGSNKKDYHEMNCKATLTLQIGERKCVRTMTMWIDHDECLEDKADDKVPTVE